MRELRKFHRIRKYGERTVAVVVDYEEDGVGTDKTFPAWVQFRTAAGTLVQSKARSSTSVRPERGMEVAIMYDPETPNEFYCQKSYAPLLFIIAFALYFIGIAICVHNIIRIARLEEWL
jgi:hypothetical protein